jgi:hypothetical protein
MVADGLVEDKDDLKEEDFSDMDEEPEEGQS